MKLHAQELTTDRRIRGIYRHALIALQNVTYVRPGCGTGMYVDDRYSPLADLRALCRLDFFGLSDTVVPGCNVASAS